QGQRQARRRFAKIEPDQRESRTADAQVGGAERQVRTATATHPEEAPKIHSGSRGGGGIERLVGVDEGGHRSSACDAPQAGRKEARATGRPTPDDLRDLTAANPRHV